MLFTFSQKGIQEATEMYRNGQEVLCPHCRTPLRFKRWSHEAKAYRQIYCPADREHLTIDGAAQLQDEAFWSWFEALAPAPTRPYGPNE